MLETVHPKCCWVFWAARALKAYAGEGCGNCRHCQLDFLERWFVNANAAIVVPLDDGIFIRFYGAEFSSGLAEVAQGFDAISRNQVLAVGGHLGERRPSGTI